MGTKVPWLLASKASEFAKESDFQTTKSQLDDFAKVSGDYITEGDADKKYETKEDAKKYWKPEVTEDGVIDWTLTDTTTKPTQRNIKGDKGDDGDDGVSPHIGDNGHWYIGEEDTNVEAKGPKGDAFKYEDFTPAQLEALKGDPGDPGEPGHSPVITTQVDATNNAVKILADGEVIGTIKNGEDGTDGVSPTVSSEETTDETGRTGTKVTITYDGEESPEEFTIWNGKDGAASDLPAAPDGAGKYVLEKTADSKIQWHNLDDESSTLTGVENQITVTTVGTKTSVGLAEKVITQLGKLDDQLTLAEGTGITFDTTKDGVLKISSTGGGGGKPIKGVDGQISVTDKTAYDEVGLHENVLAKLEELENPLTITGGDNIDVAAGENDTVVISYTGKEFPADGLHDGLNVLSAKGADYEWVLSETYKFDTATLSGTGSTEKPIGVDTDALNEMYLPMSGNTQETPITGTVIIENEYFSVRNTNEATEAQVRADNATDTFAFNKGAWIKRHDLDGNNNNMAAFGVTNSNNLTAWDDGALAAMDPNGIVRGSTANTPIGIFQKNGADGEGWAAWTPRFSFPMIVHDEGTTITWGKDNTLHFILEPES